MLTCSVLSPSRAGETGKANLVEQKTLFQSTSKVQPELNEGKVVGANGFEPSTSWSRTMAVKI